MQVFDHYNRLLIVYPRSKHIKTVPLKTGCQLLLPLWALSRRDVHVEGVFMVHLAIHVKQSSLA